MPASQDERPLNLVRKSLIEVSKNFIPPLLSAIQANKILNINLKYSKIDHKWDTQKSQVDEIRPYGNQLLTILKVTNNPPIYK